MSKPTDNVAQLTLPSDLTPKQLESLPFDPGALSNFDEKEKLPPTARAQWAYVQHNPADFLDRFTSELGLLGVNVAICFINKDPYEDNEKELKTPITVNLIVQPDQFNEVKAHLKETNLSHQVMDDEKGFALPYLGSIQKMLDTLALEKLISYIFLKNSITREAYFTWISVPKQYLAIKRSGSGMKKSPVDKKEKDVEETSVGVVEEGTSKSKLPVPSDSRKDKGPTENFNYVIYDETGETVPPIIPQPESPKSNSVIVAADPIPEKESFLSQLTQRFSSKKKVKEKNQSDEPSSPTAKSDSALFLSLSLFNFYCSVILLTFLGNVVEAIGSVMLEAVTFSALAALLFAIFVIRPSFRQAKSRIWALGSYTVYSAAAGYQISQVYMNPESSGYLVSTALALVCLMSALISAFMRIDRLSIRKSKPTKAPTMEEENVASEGEDNESNSIAEENTTSQIAKDLPPPARPKSTKAKSKKIELKSANKPEAQLSSTSETAARPEQKDEPVKARPKRAIPVKPITEAQKDAIRSRLSRKDLLSSQEKPDDKGPENKKARDEGQMPLSTAEIKAKLAERLQQTRTNNNGLNGTSQTKDKAPEPIAQTDPSEPLGPKANPGNSIEKPVDATETLEESNNQSDEKVNKLSLPNT